MKRTRYLVTALVVLATAATAWAFYSVPGSGNANAAGTVGTMTAPTLSDPSPSGGSVSLNWTAATLPGNPSLNSQITYEVQRNRDNTGWESAVATCTGISATSCTDTVATSGSYAYRVLAKFRTWSALSTEKTTPVTVGGGTPSPATPTSVALANGGGVGNAYVNAANRASLSVQVGLPASSSSSDTVHVVITDTASHSTADRTVGASAGAGTVTVTSIDATGLDDGSLTIRATASNSSGDSDEKTGSVTKDTVKPSSEVSSVANITTGSTFTVNYTSADAAPSATLEKVDLYVDDPGSGGFALAGTDAAPSATGSFAYSGATQDGSYGFYTRATDKAGNVEDAQTFAEKTATRNTDPVPRGVDLQATNAGGSPGASRIRSNDTLIFTFSEAIKSTSIVSTWTNPAAPLTGQSMVVKQNSTTDRIETLGSLNIGVVELQSNFVDSDVTFGVTLALNSDRTVLTVTFGTASGGTLRNGAANAATMKWSPDSDLRDDSNQQIDTTQVDETGTLDSDF